MADSLTDKAGQIDAEVDRLTRERDAVTVELDRVRADLERAERLAGIAVAGEAMKPPRWLTPKATKKKHRGTLCAILSDLHFDEVVNPDEIDGVNAYSRTIAEMRLRRWAERVVAVARYNVSDVELDGIVVMLGGDIFSGNLHDLAETNEDTMMGSLLHWSEQIAAALRVIADEFGRVHVPAVVGNHGRFTRKPRTKLRARDNADWALAHLVARYFADDDRFTFDIPDAPDCFVSVYSTTHLLTHGDQVSGGGGIGGIWPPIMRMAARKQQRYAARGGFDVIVMGHWHQLISAPSQGLIVNGCFPSGSKVPTSSGYTPIEQVAIGDEVMSRDGTSQKVTHVFTREAHDGTVGLKVMGLPRPMWSTPNHLVWALKANSATSSVPPSRRDLIGPRTSRAQWVPSGFLSPGDYVHVPFPTGAEEPVTPEDAWAYGVYIAEGHDTLDGGSSGKHNRVHITMHRNERAIVDRWAAWFEGRFGVAPRVTHRKGRNTTDLAASPGRDTVAWFRSTFGHGAKNKHLPDGALWWSDDLKRMLLEGWVTGDGHSAEQEDCRPTVSATTISERLAWEMFHIAPASGVWPALALLSAGGPRKNDAYTVHLNTGQNVVIIEGEAFYKIAERYERPDVEPVFDLEVDGEHTYVVEGVGVHNSMKGYDEFAAVGLNARPEPPQQALWLVTPEHGVTLTAPIFCADPKAEGWG